MPHSSPLLRWGSRPAGRSMRAQPSRTSALKRHLDRDRDVQETGGPKVVDAVMAEIQRGGFPGLGRQLDALRGVMAHAPVSYPALERRGERQIVHNADDDGRVSASLRQC